MYDSLHNHAQREHYCIHEAVSDGGIKMTLLKNAHENNHTIFTLSAQGKWWHKRRCQLGPFYSARPLSYLLCGSLSAVLVDNRGVPTHLKMRDGLEAGSLSAQSCLALTC